LATDESATTKFKEGQRARAIEKFLKIAQEQKISEQSERRVSPETREGRIIFIDVAVANLRNRRIRRQR